MKLARLSTIIVVLLLGFLSLFHPIKTFAYSERLYTADWSYYYLDYVSTETSVSVNLTDGGYSTVMYYKIGDYSAPTRSLVANESSTASAVISTGLQPNRAYPTLLFVEWFNNWAVSRTLQSYFWVRTEVQAATNPIYSQIGANQVTVSWTRNNNYKQPLYRLYKRSTLAGPWELAYLGNAESVVIANLSYNTTYYFYVETQGMVGPNKNSGLTSVMTSDDPAVSAAIAAKGAAEAFMTASESAKTSVDNMTTEFQTVKTDITAIKASIETDLTPPTISKFVHSSMYITAIKEDSTDYLVEAYDNKTESASLTYRYKINGGAFSTWAPLTTNNVNINVGSSNGLKQVSFEVRDNAGLTSTATEKIWRF